VSQCRAETAKRREGSIGDAVPQGAVAFLLAFNAILFGDPFYAYGDIRHFGGAIG
jgi:hypothetical protein